MGDFLEELWSILDQMINMTSKCLCWPKILKFDCMLTTVDFLPNIVSFQSFEPLTEQTCDARHETWYEHYSRPMENHGNHLIPFQIKLPWKTQNPSCGPIA